MGQINTNNYPTVSSLADADLLIVENAINGTGTTTPKQLRENAIGTDTLETTAQTVTGAINELKDEIDSGTSFTLAGAGSEKNYSSGVVDTDIYLHRAPKIGDRLLIRFVSTYTSPPSIKVYDEEGGTAYTLSFGQWSSVYKLSGICLLEVVDFLGDLALDFIYNFNGKEYQSGNGIAISGTTIRNTAMQKGDNAAYVEVDEPITSGNLGFGNGDARYLFVNFEVDVTPNDTTHLYYMFLTSGLAMGLAVLKDRDGNDFSKNLYAGMMLFCKRESGGSGTEGDPYILTVVSVFDWSVGDDGAIKAGGRVQDGEGNDLASVAALEQSASGNPIIVNAQPVDAKELSVELEPIQDLHGYDHPWAGGAGKNKLPLTLANLKSLNTGGIWSGNSYTLNNVSFDVQTDEGGNVTGIKGNGTANANTTFVISPFMDLSAFNGMLINGNTAAVDDAIIRTEMEASPWTGYSQSGGTDATIGTYAAGTNGRTFIRVFSGKTLTNQMFYPMIRNSSDSAVFSPYTNICPISGRTSGNVKAEGKNFVKNTFAPNRSAGIAVTNNNDGSITISGTHSASSGSTVIQSWGNQIPTGSFKYSIGNTLPSNADTIQIIATHDEQSTADYISLCGGNSSEIDFTYTAEQKAAYPYIRVSINIYYTDTWGTARTYYPMIRPSGASGDYEKYKTPTSATLSFGQTVYGGQVDFKTGRVRVDRAIVDLGTLIWSKDTTTRTADGATIHAFYAGISACKKVGNTEIANMLCSVATAQTVQRVDYGGGSVVMDNICGGADNNSRIWLYSSAYNEMSIEQFKTAVTGQTICYELATPTELTLTPQALGLLKGYNYITGDGEMSMVYIPESVLPTPPTTDGTYKLICTVANGIPTFSWAAN